MGNLPSALTKCHCGKDLHYNDPKIQNDIQDLVDRFGEFITIVVVDKMTKVNRKFRVQRHYIALHGIKGKDVAKLGFPEIKHDGKV